MLNYALNVNSISYFAGKTICNMRLVTAVYFFSAENVGRETSETSDSFAEIFITP